MVTIQSYQRCSVCKSLLIKREYETTIHLKDATHIMDPDPLFHEYRQLRFQFIKRKGTFVIFR